MAEWLADGWASRMAGWLVPSQTATHSPNLLTLASISSSPRRSIASVLFGVFEKTSAVSIAFHAGCCATAGWRRYAHTYVGVGIECMVKKIRDAKDDLLTTPGTTRCLTSFRRLLSWSSSVWDINFVPPFAPPLPLGLFLLAR